MGVLGAYKESVTLINRTNRFLNVRFDGEDTQLAPGENPGFPKIAVPYAKKQNPLMGSKHPVDPRRYICLVGVKDTKDDVTPIPQDVLDRADRCLEVVDREGLFYGEPMERRQLLKRTPYSPYEAAVTLPGEFDVNRNIE